MRTRHSRAGAALLAALLAACGREPPPPPPERPAVMVYVPKLRGSIVVDTTGAVDAERLTMVVSVSADSVAAFYHGVLTPGGWRILSDRTDQRARIRDLYASRGPGNATLWIHIEAQDSASSRYTLIATSGLLAPSADTIQR